LDWEAATLDRSSGSCELWTARLGKILDEEYMTLLEVTFTYGLPPGERELQALGRVRQVYGVRKTWFDEKAHTIRVEYDASRLTEHDIAALLRNAGIDIRTELRTAA